MADAERNRILVVDDDEFLREALAFDFERSGYEVLCAASGKEASAVLTKEKVDLVVSDIRMPDGDGLWLLRHIQALPGDRPPVIFITGLPDITAQACGPGAFAVFSKPFSRNALMECVARALQPVAKNWKQRPERLKATFDVELRFSESPEARQSKTLNLSSGGMFVVLQGEFPSVDTEISFKLGYKSSGRFSSVEGTAIVRWVREKVIDSKPPGIGLEFAEIAGGMGKQPILELLEVLRSEAISVS